MALFEEIIGAVSVSEIIELPRFSRGNASSNHVLIDQNLDGPKVAGEVASVSVGLGYLQRSDLRVVLGGCRVSRGPATPATRRASSALLR